MIGTDNNFCCRSYRWNRGSCYFAGAVTDSYFKSRRLLVQVKSPKFIFYVLQNVILLQLIGIPTRGSEWAYFRLLRICLVRSGWVTVFGWIYRLRMWTVD